jgi:hypothetical protein
LPEVWATAGRPVEMRKRAATANASRRCDWVGNFIRHCLLKNTNEKNGVNGTLVRLEFGFFVCPKDVRERS